MPDDQWILAQRLHQRAGEDENSGALARHRRYAGAVSDGLHHTGTASPSAPVPPAAPATGAAAARAGNGAAQESVAARVVVISNPRSHRNRSKILPLPAGVRLVEPATRQELRDVLNGLPDPADMLIVIAGGDGTIRDVLTCGGELWADAGGGPAVALLPRGKTNALARDLAIPDGWEVADAIAAWQAGRQAERSPIEITAARDAHASPVRGYLFGAGAFVAATDMAQTTHRLGAFNNLAVGLSTLGTVLKVVFGSANSPWRAGKRMRISFGSGAVPMHGAALKSEAKRFIVLVTTMQAMPLGVRPFGGKRAGMKALVVDAPPRRFVRNFTRIVRGSTDPALEQEGMHRVDADVIDMEIDGGFILDGERFDAGHYCLRKGAPVRFVSG